jgi:hypothetical protein
MTWTLSTVIRVPNANPSLSKLLMTVTMVFANVDVNGVTSDRHTYVEQNVSDASDVGVAKLARDHMRQLEAISATPTGTVSDLTAIKTLMTVPTRLASDVVAAVAAVSDFTLTDQAITDALNTANVANPVTIAPKIKPTINLPALIGSLTVQAQSNLADNPNTPTLRADARAGDTEALVQWAGLFAEKALITPQDFAAVQTACALIDDPTWTALVSHATLILNRPITVDEVAVVRATHA